MLKNFKDMRKVEITKYTQKRDGFDYLNWADCIALLYENGAEKVFFEPLTNANGSSLFMADKVFTDKKENTNSCYEVAVRITIDEDVFTMRTPLMNGSNPVKDYSLNQQRVWNAQTRAFVKGVAIRTGLGFDLWRKAEEENIVNNDDDLSIHNILKIKERIFELVTEKMKKGYSIEELAKACRYPSSDEFEVVLKTYFNSIYNIEGLLRKLPDDKQ